MPIKIVYFALVLLAVSCSDDDFEVANVRVNHFKQSAIGVVPTLVLLIQEGDEIGSDEWKYQYSGIDGFDYEWGYVYDLKIKKKTIDNPPQDGSSIEFILEELISKEAIGEGVVFDIKLKSNTVSYLTGDASSGFALLNQQAIDCSDLCQELTQLMNTDGGLIGQFSHAASGKLQLQQVTVE